MSDGSSSPEVSSIRHGTNSGYNYKACRCVECRAWKSNAHKRFNARWPERNRQRVLQWQKEKPEKHRAKNALYIENNPGVRKDYSARYLQENLDKHRDNQARRRSQERQQVCSCCSAEDRRAFYRARPDGYEVDHRKPISRGGPHCLKNMQYLTPIDNRRKGTKIVFQ